MKLEKAFQLGVAFCTGYRYQLRASLSLDSHIEKPKFFTNKQNKKVAYDPKTHETSGNGKEIDKATEQQAKKVKKTFPKSGKNLMDDPPSKDVTTYLKEASGNYNKAIKRYVENELIGGVVETKFRTKEGDKTCLVGFNGKTKSEFCKFQGNLKAVLSVLPYIPEVINKGSYVGYQLDRKNHPGIYSFHTVLKHVKINGKSPVVILDVAEMIDRKNFFSYSVNVPGTSTYEFKKKKSEGRIRRQRNTRESNAVLPSSKDSVSDLHRNYPWFAMDSSVKDSQQKVNRYSIKSLLIVSEDGENVGSISFKEG